MTIAEKKEHFCKLTPQVSAPPIISSFDELEIPQVIVENLILKHLAAYPKSDILELAKYLGIVTHLIEDILADLRKKHL